MVTGIKFEWVLDKDKIQNMAMRHMPLLEARTLCTREGNALIAAVYATQDCKDYAIVVQPPDKTDEHRTLLRKAQNDVSYLTQKLDESRKLVRGLKAERDALLQQNAALRQASHNRLGQEIHDRLRQELVGGSHRSTRG